MELTQLRLVFEKFELAGSTRHMKEDNVFGLRLQGWNAGVHGLGRIDDREVTGLQLPEQ